MNPLPHVPVPTAGPVDWVVVISTGCLIIFIGLMVSANAASENTAAKAAKVMRSLVFIVGFHSGLKR